jgi:hypothetical protein
MKNIITISTMVRNVGIWVEDEMNVHQIKHLVFL